MLSVSAWDIAAEMLVTAGDNTDRIRSEAAFAKMCGAGPIPAGSGKTNGRHCLNRGGNRQANAALYRAVIVRRRWHQPTIDYVKRRTAESLSKREIIRSLKRYLALEINRLLPEAALASPTGTVPAKLPEALAIYRSINALAESCFASLKGECIDTRTWATKASARSAIAEYSGWFNGSRLHSPLGYLTPNEYEAATALETFEAVA